MSSTFTNNQQAGNSQQYFFNIIIIIIIHPSTQTHTPNNELYGLVRWRYNKAEEHNNGSNKNIQTLLKNKRHGVLENKKQEELEGLNQANITNRKTKLQIIIKEIRV